METSDSGQGLPQSPPTREWPPRSVSILSVVLVLACYPIIAWGARGAWLQNQNRVEDWLPSNFPETRSLEQFFNRFGSDEFLIVSWDGCTLSDPRCKQLSALLVSTSPASGKAYFKSAVTGEDILSAIQRSQQGRSKEALKSRIEGLFLGKDGEQTCVIASVSDSGLRDRKSAVSWARQAALRATSLPPSQIHIAGSTVDSVAVDEASAQNLAELNLLSMLVCFSILYISIRNFWMVAFLFLGALLNQQLALAIMYYSYGRIDAVLLLVANLSFVLTLSAGLHYLGYFQEATRAGSPSRSLSALRDAWRPSLLAALTTAIGFVSLCTSEIIPIRMFGLFAAIVVPINSAIIIVGMAIHAPWTSRCDWRFRPVTTPSEQRMHWKASRPLVHALRHHPLLLISAWMLIALLFGLGIAKLKTSVGTHQLLPSSNPLIEDYAWIEKRIGPLVPIEIALVFPAQNSMTFIERVQILDSLRREILTIPDIKATWSVMNILPPIPISSGARPTVKRSVVEKTIEESEDRLIEMGLLHKSDQEEVWRISGRVSGLGKTDYESLIDKVSQAVHAFMEKHPHREVGVDISGGVPFVYRVQRQLLVDLLNSFTSAFAMIAITMSIVFRSASAGLLCMLPNVTPAAVVFGAMGWLGLEVELGTVLTASVIMGVCVDDTLHLITHYRMQRQKGQDPAEAVEDALANCGGAMTQTALVCGLGMLVFALSPFTPIARFAWLTFALLMIGLISDLILTPAILLSPFHRVFTRNRASVPSHARAAAEAASGADA
ncbi:MAG: efflux RND transporter permease subunit [Planctomycetota bacterium]